MTAAQEAEAVELLAEFLAAAARSRLVASTMKKAA